MTGSKILNRQSSGSDQAQQVDCCKSENTPCSSGFLPMENSVPEIIETSSKISAVQYDSGTEDHSNFDATSRTTCQTPFENEDDPEEVHHDDTFEEACTTGYEQTDYHNKFAQDLRLASRVPDHEKKDFCESAKVVFHGDFVLKILGPIIERYLGIMYSLFAETENMNTNLWFPTALIVTDNAKGQFKCDSCGHSWTSMRSRIAFRISDPSPCSFISLRIFGQSCKECNTLTYPLWYMDEISRVMTNLAKIFFSNFFPDIFHEIYGNDIPAIQNGTRRIPYDLKQRNGCMKKPHDASRCEACQYGCCFVLPNQM